MDEELQQSAQGGLAQVAQAAPQPTGDLTGDTLNSLLSKTLQNRMQGMANSNVDAERKSALESYQSALRAAPQGNYTPTEQGLYTWIGNMGKTDPFGALASGIAAGGAALKQNEADRMKGEVLASQVGYADASGRDKLDLQEYTKMIDLAKQQEKDSAKAALVTKVGGPEKMANMVTRANDIASKQIGSYDVYPNMSWADYRKLHKETADTIFNDMVYNMQSAKGKLENKPGDGEVVTVSTASSKNPLMDKPLQGDNEAARLLAESKAKVEKLGNDTSNPDVQRELKNQSVLLAALKAAGADANGRKLVQAPSTKPAVDTQTKPTDENTDRLKIMVDEYAQRRREAAEFKNDVSNPRVQLANENMAKLAASLKANGYNTDGSKIEGAASSVSKPTSGGGYSDVFGHHMDMAQPESKITPNAMGRISPQDIKAKAEETKKIGAAHEKYKLSADYVDLKKANSQYDTMMPLLEKAYRNPEQTDSATGLKSSVLSVANAMGVKLSTDAMKSLQAANSLDQVSTILGTEEQKLQHGTQTERDFANYISGAFNKNSDIGTRRQAIRTLMEKYNAKKSRMDFVDEAMSKNASPDEFENRWNKFSQGTADSPKAPLTFTLPDGTNVPLRTAINDLYSKTGDKYRPAKGDSAEVAREKYNAALAKIAEKDAYNRKSVAQHDSTLWKRYGKNEGGK